jgi:hypothetical protein
MCNEIALSAKRGDVSNVNVNFNLDILRKQTSRRSTVPLLGNSFVFWDTALTDGDRADFSVGFCGFVPDVPAEEKPPLWLLDCVVERFSPAELPYQICKFNRKHAPKATAIEAIPGWTFLKLQIEAEAKKQNQQMAVLWQPPSRRADRKRRHIKKLEMLSTEYDRLRLVSGPWIDIFFEQAERYLSTRSNSGRHDDVLDAAAGLVQFVPLTNFAVPE